MNLSAEQLAALPCCRSIAEDNGPSSKYVGDAAIRWYRGRKLAELCRDIGIDPVESLTLSGGIGTLVMRLHGNEWTPTPSLGRMALGIAGAVGAAARAAIHGESVRASDDLVERRLATCRACPLWVVESSRCGACGCFTTAKAALAASTCPKGWWPT